MILDGLAIKDLTGILPDGRGDPTGRPYEKRPLSAIRYVVIHHVGAGPNRDFTAQEIAEYHVHQKGWPGIGYHYLVHTDGSIDLVGDLPTTRYHCGRLNQQAIGVCLAGDFTQALPANEQLASAARLAAGLEAQLGRPLIVVGHGDLPAQATGVGRTDCPGQRWEHFRQRF